MSSGAAVHADAQDDARWMALALSLGRRGMGRVWPNPAVGCVIVKDGRVLGRGWTQDGGRPHAETVALAQAGGAARGADVFVTLEPCAHTGKTPPCCDALIAAGVARVVVAISDPDERVAGQGLARLRAAGIDVVTGVLAQDAKQDHAGFLLRIEQHRPFVTLKLAMSLDGRIATASGESQWITGPEARRAVHAMRVRHDAVMVGAGTARADAPSLTVRGLGVARQPVRVVLSRTLDVPRSGPLFDTAQTVPVWLVHCREAPPEARKAWADAGARLLEGADGTVASALQALAAQGLTRVFCEGGGAVAASLLEAGLVDELVVFHAGLVLGAGGVAGVAALPDGALGAAPRWSLQRTQQIGADTLQVWRRASRPNLT
ncbi:bifunctional diaminohydroxyphosphoribosylaminopyrimidine deaminase/5-amino-6-(5-phosphoribosylamino)uracil reductase RibD [uncultured Litoreibacter sp.]|uniref:bifunctional diaminohydroxyphosphoribosylaminopyrimidine deaminase/5-amino-6-(5-phosphoribosylamino)uracil reductase RibD n=1 Tax=uncultured Litoreibacter sp. TaxID=1392394 RepID=UPI00263247B6|nr:bifunctional diaminohydroxyphosphoribosylaminopyrimidine deaminase/5-amino-6-(5-phosphoribosylamino)uracil reductase RibD [uncultured Litoreibacter sp.]